MTSVFIDLNDNEIENIRGLGSRVAFSAGEQIFEEGDVPDAMYFVDEGQVALYIERFHTRVPIRTAFAGDWFGETAMYDRSRRTAAAMAAEESSLLRVSAEAFHALLDREPTIDSKIRDIVESRNEALVLEEKMVDMERFHRGDLHIGIKGDPSMRESAMQRPRYESIVDRSMPELVPCLEDLLLNRNVHRVVVGFNNGEVRLSTLLDPFSDEYHPVLRLLDESYVQRHFPRIDYQAKAEIVRGFYRMIEGNELFEGLPGYLRHGFRDYYRRWEPLAAEEVSRVIRQIPVLRQIPHFYVRGLTLGITRDAIHMQFNCDGTHIVSSRGYERFLQENL